MADLHQRPVGAGQCHPRRGPVPSLPRASAMSDLRQRPVGAVSHRRLLDRCHQRAQLCRPVRARSCAWMRLCMSVRARVACAHACVRVCVCVRACVDASVYECVCARARADACVCVFACVHACVRACVCWHPSLVAAPRFSQYATSWAMRAGCSTCSYLTTKSIREYRMRGGLSRRRYPLHASAMNGLDGSRICLALSTDVKNLYQRGALCAAACSAAVVLAVPVLVV